MQKTTMPTDIETIAVEVTASPAPMPTDTETIAVERAKERLEETLLGRNSSKFFAFFMIPISYHIVALVVGANGLSEDVTVPPGNWSETTLDKTESIHNAYDPVYPNYVPNATNCYNECLWLLINSILFMTPVLFFVWYRMWRFRLAGLARAQAEMTPELRASKRRRGSSIHYPLCRCAELVASISFGILLALPIMFVCGVVGMGVGTIVGPHNAFCPKVPHQLAYTSAILGMAPLGIFASLFCCKAVCSGYDDVKQMIRTTVHVPY